MNEYKKNIKFLIKNKYREANYHNKNFLDDFKSFREYFKKEIIKKPFQLKLNTKEDTTLLELKNYFETKKYNQARIELYFKKFEVNFKLKSKYNKDLKLLTNKETCFQSYIYLGHLIVELKRIDIFQKLNIILKILDKLSINKKKYKYYNIPLLLQLLKIEEKLINKILK
jgi:hypothetical protein